MLSVLNNPEFRRLWSAGVLSRAGSEMSRLAIMLYLVHEQQSAAAIAMWIAVRALPGVVATPWIGVMVDHVNPRRLLIGADLVRAALLLMLAAYARPWLVVAAAVVESLASSVFEPTRRASVPRLVESDRLERANGLDQTSNTVVMIVGPVVGAQLFLGWGLAVALIADAVSFVLSAVLIARMAIPGRADPLKQISWNYADVVESWRAVASDARIRVVVTVQFVSLLCTALWAPMAPFFIRDVLRASESQLGWQFSAFGVGGAVGAVIAPKLAQYWPTGRLFVGALLLEGLHMLVYSITSHWLLSLLCIFSWGMSVSVIVVSSVSYLQRTLPASSMGRVFALIRQSEQLGLLLAMAIAAGLSQAARPQLVLALAGVVYVATTLAAAGSRGGRPLWRSAGPVTRGRQLRPADAGAPTFAGPVE